MTDKFAKEKNIILQAAKKGIKTNVHLSSKQKNM